MECSDECRDIFGTKKTFVCKCLGKRGIVFQLLINTEHVSFSSAYLFLPDLCLMSTLSVSISRRHALWGWGSLMVTMVPGSRYVCSTHAREEDPQNDREERILAMLGIIGTILNLLVVIFVYIYTTVT